jgi:hypothetical protein
VNGRSDSQSEDDRAGQRSVFVHGPSALPFACVLIYLVVVLALFLAIFHGNNGVFTYSLDDPYIHLALAENLAHGHYGINPGEASSPSSSIVWPFLLVPFAGTAWHMVLPLAWNVLFCGIAAWLIGWVVDGWRWAAEPAAPPAWWIRFSFAIALMLIANLAGLTMIGMEHGLQVLLAICCAAGMAEVFAGRPMHAWCLAAAVLGPMVRYENFAMVPAVAIALYGLGRTRAAWTMACLSLVGPALFSAFLLSRGLPALPSSVLIKAKVYDAHGGALLTAITTVSQSVYWGVQEPAWYAQLAVAITLAVLAAREKHRVQRFILAGALIAAALQLVLGRYNWFHRYEVAGLVFTALLTCTALVRMMKHRRTAALILLPSLLVLAFPYLQAIYLTPRAASNVYQQQYQMHRFLTDYYRSGAVAVNDLGWVSYRRPPGLHVLDLWGLASPEASRQTVKDDTWLDAMTRSHGAGLAIVYPDWYEGIPEAWKPLGTMCMMSPKVLSARCVVFYSTAVGDTAALTAELAAFTRTLPPTVQMTLGRDSTADDE